MSDLHLASRNTEKFPWKLILWIMIKLTPWGRPKDAMLRLSLWDVFKTFLGRFSKTERVWNNFLVYNTHVCWTKTENFTTEMSFVLMFKMDVLRTLPSGHHFGTFIRRLWDVSPKPKTINSQLFSALGTHLVK